MRPTLFEELFTTSHAAFQVPVSPLSLTLPCDDRQAGLLRVRIRQWCERAHLGAEIREDALIIASELFSNAVRAAATATTVGVLLIHERETVTVYVANSGPPFALADIASPSAQRAGAGASPSPARSVRCSSTTAMESPWSGWFW